MLILDNILYNGEAIIDFRLRYLYNYVDKFIIVENLYTHSGKKKDDYYYNINKDKFKEFEDKIIFIPLDHYLPTGEEYQKIINIINYVKFIELKDSWICEMYQRNYIQYKLKELFNEPYIIFVCDIDEIPKLGLYKQIKNDYNKLDDGVHLEMSYLLYGFDWKKTNSWYHSFVINDKGANKYPFSLVRLTNWNTFYKNVGWHISYYSSIKEIKRKLHSFTHTEFDKEEFTNEEYIKNCVKNGLGLHDRNEDIIKTEEKELPENYKEIDMKMRIKYPEKFD